MRIKLINTLKLTLLISISTALFIFIAKNLSDFSFIFIMKTEYLFIILLLMFLEFFLTGCRFYLSIHSVSDRVTFGSCLKYFAVGRFLGEIIPQSAGLYRAINLKKRDGISYKNFASCHFFFIWVNPTFSFLLGSIIVGAYDISLSISGINIFGTLIVLFSLSLLFIPLLKILFKASYFIRKMHNKKSFLSQFVYVIDGISSIMRNKLVFVASVAIVFLTMFIGIISLHFYFISIGAKTTFPALAAFAALSRAGNTVQITPGNWGIKEFLLGFLSNSIGIGIAEGVSLSIILRIISYVVHGTLGLAFVFFDKFDKCEVKTP